MQLQCCQTRYYFEGQVKKKFTSSKLSRIKNMLGYEISAEIPLESILKKKHKV